MPISQQRLAYLLNMYSRGKASDEEIDELFTWLKENDGSLPVSERIRQLMEQFYPSDQVPATPPQAGAHTLPVEKLPVRRIPWSRAVTAAIILLLGSTVLLYRLNQGQKPPSATPPPAVQHLAADIKPGADGVILTLANGQKIVLDSAGDGALTIQGNTLLLNQHGQLSYCSKGPQQEEVLYNTITTTRGREYQLHLADGSRVWLNAASAIKFPASFNGGSRNVEVSGEAYFEVAANPAQPFKIHILTAGGGGGEVQAPGTHFNINAYDDEGLTRITLLEGSIKVSPSTRAHSKTPIESRPLKIGEQAQLTSGAATIKVVTGIDIEETMAWKNGLFLMKKTDISALMRQIARWYDVEVIYKGQVPTGRLSGDIPRNMNLPKVLELLELSGMHVILEGKKIIVSSLNTPSSLPLNYPS